MSKIELMVEIWRQIKSPENLDRIAAIVSSHVRRDRKTLVYILPQTSRIGHFATEMQILESLYRVNYEQIIVITELMDKPGTNRWIPQLLDKTYQFVECDDQIILFTGMLREDGILRCEGFDLLLKSPQTMHLEFFEFLANGGSAAKLQISDEIVEKSRSALNRHRCDPDQPAVLLHIRTSHYLPGLRYNDNRATNPSVYRAAVSRLIDLGYRVYRIGEQGIDIGLSDAAYCDTTGWFDSDRYLDLYLSATVRFGLMTDSGPSWALNALGKKAIRTNCPHNYPNFNYLDDPNLFKKCRRQGSEQFLTYAEAMAADLPLMVTMQQINDNGFELIDHDATTIEIATVEMADHIENATEPNAANRARIQTLSAGLETRMATMTDSPHIRNGFFGMARGKGWVPAAMLQAQPNYLD